MAAAMARAPVGQQPEVPAPGKNEKKVVYGGVDYNTGQLTYTLADTKCGASFLVFLVTLLLAYAGMKIRLVCDNGRFHTTKAVRANFKPVVLDAVVAYASTRSDEFRLVANRVDLFAVERVQRDRVLLGVYLDDFAFHFLVGGCGQASEEHQRQHRTH
jgi:hypothetical protein